MIKNVFYFVLVAILAAISVKMLVATDIRDEAWRCDRLIRQGRPTTQYCADVRAAEAALPDQSGYAVALGFGAILLGAACALDLRAEARKERTRKRVYRMASQAAAERLWEMNLVGFVERRK